MATQQEELLHFNGIDGSSGQYLFPPAKTQELAELALAWQPDPESLEDFRRAARVEPAASPPEIADGGWGVIFAARADENEGREIRTALSELLDHRRKQAGESYREFTGRNGYRRNESPRQFTDRQPLGRDLPYYLLLVGDPEAIPYDFQCELALRHAVGRIHFDFPADYLAYSNSVLRAEESGPTPRKRAAFFALEQRGDPVSAATARQLVQPLARPLIDNPPAFWKAEGWVSQAEKADLAQHLGGPETPHLLFTAGHGIGFPEGYPQQLREQGALLCPGWSPAVHSDGNPVPVSPAYYFAASDVAADASMPGLISFHYSSYAAGTPRYSYNQYAASPEASPAVAERSAFVAGLPKALLAREAGALAFVGPCDRVWGFPSNDWEPSSTVRGLFEEAIRRLMRGFPVGAALEPFKIHHADVALRLAELGSFEQSRRSPDVSTLANFWMVLNDTRNLIVIGDPAVRFPVGKNRSVDGEPAEVKWAAGEPGSGQSTEVPEAVAELPAEDAWPDMTESPARGPGDTDDHGLTKTQRVQIAEEVAGLGHRTEGLNASVPVEQGADEEAEDQGERSPEQQPAQEVGTAQHEEPAAATAAAAAGGGGGGRRPPRDDPPTIINNFQVFDLSRYEPPARDRRITFRVRHGNARLESDDPPSSSRVAVDTDALLRTQLDPQAYGERLFAMIVNTDGDAGVDHTDAGYRAAMNRLAANEATVRFELLIDEADETHRAGLNSYAWEFLRPSKQYAVDLPLAARRQSPFYRKLDFPTRPLRIKERTLKVLVAICNPRQVGDTQNEILGKLTPLQVAAEAEIMRVALKRLQDTGLLKFDILGEKGERVTVRAITEALQEDGGYHVLHLLGHGIFTQHRPPDNYYLVMDREDNKLPFVSVEEFKTVLDAGSLRMVTLAACNSAVTQSGDALRGLGPQLVRSGVPAVIAMQRDMPIDAAQYFTQHFYDDLARSGRVDMAMAETRLALFQRDPKRLDWGIPVLYFGHFQDNDWGRLFEPDAGVASSVGEMAPDIRTYDKLGVTQDPAIRSMLQMAHAQAATMGAPQMAQALQQRMAAAIGEAPALAVRQNRETIDLDLAARISPAGLEAFIANHSSRLSLPKNACLQIAAALRTGKHVILIGPPGTGKTTLANVVCEYAQSLRMSAGVVATTATADWSTFDTVGGYAPSADQTLQFKSGCFLDAIAEAKWLIIDEINRAEIDKAFGELFTVLSGQQVVLPYTIGADRVRILPHARGGTEWIPAHARTASCDYVVHPNWRIIGTMNVYDKSSLFSMSLAFMRRFAFVDLDLPADYAGLWQGWIEADNALKNAADRPQLEASLAALLDTSTILMKKRALGPAITQDILRYVAARRGDGGGETAEELLAEALVLYAAPQLDGLDRETIHAIYTELSQLFGQGIAEQRGLLSRVRALYPFINEWD